MSAIGACDPESGRTSGPLRMSRFHEVLNHGAISLRVDVYLVSLLPQHPQSGLAKVFAHKQVFDDRLVFDEIRKEAQPLVQHFVHPLVNRGTFIFALSWTTEFQVLKFQTGWK